MTRADDQPTTTSRRSFLVWACATGLVSPMLAPPIAGSSAATPADIQPLLTGAMVNFTPSDPPLEAPEFAMARPDGSVLTNRDFSRRFIVLNFWATWCAPCVREMPALDALQRSFDPERVIVLALSLDRTGLRAVEPFYKRHGLENLGIYLDPKSKVMRGLRVSRLPTTLFIDGQSRILGRLEGGAEWDAPEAVALIAHLAGTAPR